MKGLDTTVLFVEQICDSNNFELVTKKRCSDSKFSNGSSQEEKYLWLLLKGAKTRDYTEALKTASINLILPRLPIIM